MMMMMMMMKVDASYNLQHLIYEMRSISAHMAMTEITRLRSASSTN